MKCVNSKTPYLSMICLYLLFSCDSNANKFCTTLPGTNFGVTLDEGAAEVKSCERYFSESITTVQELNQLIDSNKRKKGSVILLLWTDWSISSQEMKCVFRSNIVQNALGNLELVGVDVSVSNPDSDKIKTLLGSYTETGVVILGRNNETLGKKYGCIEPRELSIWIKGMLAAKRQNEVKTLPKRGRT